MQPNSQIATSLFYRTLRLCAFVSIISLSAFSQTVEVTKSTRIEKIEGKEYYIHKVIKGQTLYSISKAYNVLISEIVFENPDVIDGIKPDMELRIPVVASTTSVASSKDKSIEINGRYRVHIVEKGQTLYAVSKLYNVSIEALKQANPGMTETLSLGQQLNIPVDQLIKQDETVFTSANLNLLDDTVSAGVDTNKLNVVLLLPLFLKENETIQDTAGISSREKINLKSLNALEFYEGALLAADSLSKSGINANIHTFDIADDTDINKVLRNPVVKYADVIIGPFYGKRFDAVAAFAKQNNIVCVTPVLRKNDIVEKNRFVSKVLPSDETQINRLGDYIGRWNCKKNIIVMHTGNAEDSVLIEKLTAGINSRCDNVNLHIISTKGRSIKLVDSLIQPNVENIVMALSKDESYVSRLVLHLEKKNNPKFPRVVTLFGLSEWQDFENIEVEYFQNLNLHLPIDMFLDYNRKEVKDFLAKFRGKYLAEPGKYSYLGYDVTMYYLQIIQKHGKRFFEHPEAIHYTGLQSSFDFKKVGAEGGLENQNTFILNYNDYRLVKVN